MRKTILLFSALLVSGICIMACQKQEAIQQAPKPTQNAITLARTNDKDYRISEDTAAAWASRFQQLNTSEFGGKMPTTIILPADGVLQLQAAAAAHGVKLSGIAIHLSINANGTIKAFYTPVGMDGTNIQSYENGIDNFDRHFETYDGTVPCNGPGLCN